VPRGQNHRALTQVPPCHDEIRRRLGAKQVLSSRRHAASRSTRDMPLGETRQGEVRPSGPDRLRPRGKDPSRNCETCHKAATYREHDEHTKHSNSLLCPDVVSWSTASSTGRVVGLSRRGSPASGSPFHKSRLPPIAGRSLHRSRSRWICFRGSGMYTGVEWRLQSPPIGSRVASRRLRLIRQAVA